MYTLVFYMINADCVFCTNMLKFENKGIFLVFEFSTLYIVWCNFVLKHLTYTVDILCMMNTELRVCMIARCLKIWKSENTSQRVLVNVHEKKWSALIKIFFSGRQSRIRTDLDYIYKSWWPVEDRSRLSLSLLRHHPISKMFIQ